MFFTGQNVTMYGENSSMFERLLPLVCDGRPTQGEDSSCRDRFSSVYQENRDFFLFWGLFDGMVRIGTNLIFSDVIAEGFRVIFDGILVMGARQMLSNSDFGFVQKTMMLHGRAGSMSWGTSDNGDGPTYQLGDPLGGI